MTELRDELAVRKVEVRQGSRVTRIKGGFDDYLLASLAKDHPHDFDIDIDEIDFPLVAVGAAWVTAVEEDADD